MYECLRKPLDVLGSCRDIGVTLLGSLVVTSGGMQNLANHARKYKPQFNSTKQHRCSAIDRYARKHVGHCHVRWALFHLLQDISRPSLTVLARSRLVDWQGNHLHVVFPQPQCCFLCPVDRRQRHDPSPQLKSRDYSSVPPKVVVNAVSHWKPDCISVNMVSDVMYCVNCGDDNRLVLINWEHPVTPLLQEVYGVDVEAAG